MTQTVKMNELFSPTGLASQVLLVTTEDSIKEIFNIIGKYEKGTGAKINVEKAEGLWLGSWKQRTDKPFNLDWKNSKVK